VKVTLSNSKIILS